MLTGMASNSFFDILPMCKNCIKKKLYLLLLVRKRIYISYPHLKDPVYINLKQIMTEQRISPTSIDAYIHATPSVLQERLSQLHECIRSAAPGAEESLEWRMPAYSYKKILVVFGVFRDHIGLYPMPSALRAFSKELAKYKTGGEAIEFRLDKRLPLTLIRKIVKFRVKESMEEGVQLTS
jgi:uncharacterized protein YdhG (YjbR/CyaY superfamily)